MSGDLFKGLFDSEMTTVITLSDFLICVCSALIIGAMLTGFYIYKTRYTKSFALHWHFCLLLSVSSL